MHPAHPIRDRVILVDALDQERGQLGKQSAHERGELHRAFSVFVFAVQNQVDTENPDQTTSKTPSTTPPRWKLLLQQRAHDKYHCGGLWTNTCCSHPQPGESTHTAAEQRLFEELGCTLPLIPAGSFVYRAEFQNGLTEHEFDHVFVGIVKTSSSEDPSCDAKKIWEAPIALKINPQEIAEIRWVSEPELRAWLLKTPEAFTPWFQEALSLALNALD